MLEAFLSGADLGYALYLLPATVSSTRGPWGYGLVGGSAAANGTLELLNITKCIPPVRMKSIEMIRNNLVLSLALASLSNEVFRNEYALLSSQISITVGFTLAQIALKQLSLAPACQPRQYRCCVKLSSSRCAFHASRISRAVAPALVGGIKGAGSLYYGLSIFRGLGYDINPSAEYASMAAIALVSGASEYGHSWPAKLTRNLVESSYSGWLFLSMAMNFTTEAHKGDTAITNEQFTLYCALSATSVVMITGKRFVRDQPLQPEVQRSLDEETPLRSDQSFSSSSERRPIEPSNTNIS